VANVLLQDKIDLDLISKAKKNESRERSGKFGASSYGKCFRAQVMNRQNVKPSNPLTIDTLHMFEAGKLIHDYVQQYYPGQTEIKVESEHFIGYADIVTDDAVIDIKSVNPAYFFHSGFGEKRKTFSVSEIDAVILRKKVMNILQVADYALQLCKPVIKLVYFSRDLSYGIRAHEWSDQTANWEQAVKDEKDTLVKLWEAKELPPKAPRLYDGKECQYCPYYDKQKAECSGGA
jgi:CRISPR/Cas system-associated exonuclease Cas4 (RecB family)